jgi:hypothetical protein
MSSRSKSKQKNNKSRSKSKKALGIRFRLEVVKACTRCESDLDTADLSDP